ncbi:MAG TPA: lipoyl domain-containing protein, partial [Prolixibacteraceae bacterium]|nr:lipoyl domain-containing protein [Prolixibacteraceae bacterium]
MILEIHVPSPGESITEVEIGRWMVEDGALVRQGQEIAEVESDKATLTIVAGASGRVKIMAGEGQTVAVGALACTIDTSVEVHMAAGGEAHKPAGSASADSAGTGTSSSPTASAAALTAEAARLKITAVAREVMKEHGLLVTPEVRNKAKRGPFRPKPKAQYPNHIWGIDMTKVKLANWGWL